MILELIIPEVFLIFIIIIAIIVTKEFYISKDGLLRKLMIAYFCIEVYFFLVVALYWADMVITGQNLESDVWFLYSLLIPKLIIKLKLYSYLRHKRRD